MEKQEHIKLLRNPKASKSQLRAAIADLLGVNHEVDKKENNASLFSQCKDIFMETYREHTNIEYSFGKKDGIALSALIEKLRGIIQFPTDIAIVATFRLLLIKLPDWYKKNAFSLMVINNKFNEIIASIKNNGEKGVTDDYKANVLRTLTT